MAGPAQKIIQAAKLLAKLRDRKEKLEAELREVNKEKGKLEQQTLPKMMADAEIEKMTIEGIGTLYTQISYRGYINADDRDLANQWFKENGHGAIVKEMVHPRTLVAWVKDQMAEGKKVPDFLHAEVFDTARIRRK